LTTVSIQLPESVFSALRRDPEAFVCDMRLAAAVKWYEMQIVSQAKAAEIAGVSRAEFIDALSLHHVSPLQYTPAELEAELGDGQD